MWQAIDRTGLLISPRFERDRMRVAVQQVYNGRRNPRDGCLADARRSVDRPGRCIRASCHRCHPCLRSKGGCDLQVSANRQVSVMPQDWDALVWEHGSPFQTRQFCDTFERHWPASFQPAHVVVRDGDAVTGLAPAYFYESCPRVDYYKASGALSDPLLLSHALVGWYGFPAASTTGALTTTIAELARRARDSEAVCMFAGIDARDTHVIEAVKSAGFAVCRFHTMMVRTLDDTLDRDPLARLRSRYRTSRGAKIRRARAAGVTCRLATAADHPTAIALMTGVLERQGVDADVLSRPLSRGGAGGWSTRSGDAGGRRSRWRRHRREREFPLARPIPDVAGRPSARPVSHALPVRPALSRVRGTRRRTWLRRRSRAGGRRTFRSSSTAFHPCRCSAPSSEARASSTSARHAGSKGSRSVISRSIRS